MLCSIVTEVIQLDPVLRSGCDGVRLDVNKRLFCFVILDVSFIYTIKR